MNKTRFWKVLTPGIVFLLMIAVSPGLDMFLLLIEVQILVILVTFHNDLVRPVLARVNALTERLDPYHFAPSMAAMRKCPAMCMHLVPYCLILVFVTTPLPASAELMDDVYADFAALLDDYLIEQPAGEGGLVSAFDYEKALTSAETQQRIARQKDLLRQFDINRLNDRETATAFWINAYNFFMLAYLLEERPGGELVGSVWDYGGRYNPFRDSVFTRDEFAVGGRLYSLDEIEKETLLGREFSNNGWFDARVHFAVNCAAVGCPPLRHEIYKAGSIDRQLSDNIRLAFNTSRHLKVTGNTLYLSSLFDWYASDFEGATGDILDFVRQYASDQMAATLPENPRIRYIDYDWRLNRPENFPELTMGQ